MSDLTNDANREKINKIENTNGLDSIQKDLKAGDMKFTDESSEYMVWIGENQNICSNCHCVIDGENLNDKYKYCPNCGKKGCKNLAFEMFSNLFVCNKDEMQYADIYEMFDDIIAWLEKFHLGDDCYFVVNKTGATLYRKESPIILHKDYRKRIYPKLN